MAVLDAIYSKGFSAHLHGYGAIDAWLCAQKQPGVKQAACVIKETSKNIHMLTNAGTADLAKLFEGLRFPGVDLADAALDEKGRTWYFRCAESFCENRPSLSLLEFYMDCKSRVFYDPRGVYPALKEIRHSKNKESCLLNVLLEGFNPCFEYNRALMNAALVMAKYFTFDSIAKKHFAETAALFINLKKSVPPSQEE